MEEAESRAEELQRKLDEMEANEKVRSEVYAEYVDDDDEDYESIVADALGVSSEDIKARIEEKAELQRLRIENERFQAEKEEALKREREARESEALAFSL